MPTTTQNLCYNCFAQLEDANSPCPYCGFDLEDNRQKFPVALQAGTVLNNRYIVGRVLGQGGFGITYVAFDTQLQNRVAIKEYMPGEIATRVEGTTVSVMMNTKTDDFTYGAERFMEEARTLAKFVGHPNIAGVSSYFDENDTSYFVMDYIEGVSFKSYIANNGGKVSVEETLNVMIPVLRALTAVHNEGFIHRDVTPDNIYISKDGNVKLLDFGSARYSIGDKSKSLDVILKVGYAPKEQYIRRGRQGPFTDVYSCAACFYAALTGYLPPESLERLDHDALVPVSQAGVELPDWLDRAILKGLAVQPEDRFQSAAEFLDTIENQLMVEVPAAGQTAPAPAKKKLKPALIGGIAAALALCIGVGAFLGGRSGPEAPAADSPTAQQSGQSGGHSDTPLKKAEVPYITIRGEEYSTDLRRLELENMGLTDEDIVDLKYMINLTQLRIQGNDITDLSPVAGLTDLKYIDVRENHNLVDFSPLAGLTNLEEISYYNTAIEDYSFMANMTNLTRLEFNNVSEDADLSCLSGLTNVTNVACNGSDNNISDLSFMSGMTKLKEVYLGVSPYADEIDLSPLAGKTDLTKLNIYSNGSNGTGAAVMDISLLAGLTKLTSLQLSVGDIHDLSPISGLTSLTELRLYGNFIIEDLSFLQNLTELRSLDMGTYSNEGHSVQKDLSCLSKLTKLTSLRLDAPVESLDGLENLTGLRELRMYNSSGSTYTDVDALANLTELVTLYLPYRRSDSDNPLPPIDLSGLKNLTKLQELYINGEPASLEPLSCLTELRSLQIQANSSDTVALSLEPLSGLTKLTDLNFSGHIENGDLSALSGLTGLRSLYIYHRNYLGNDYRNRIYIQDLSPLSGLSKLSSLTVRGTAEGIDTSPVEFVKDLTIN